MLSPFSAYSVLFFGVLCVKTLSFFLVPSINLFPPDPLHFFFHRQCAELLDRQAKKQINPPPHGDKRVAKRPRDGLRRTGNPRRIWNSPMRGNRLPRPHRTNLRRRRIANGKYKLHLRRAGHREFIPALAPQSLSRQPRQLKLLQCVRIHSTGRMAARAERAKVGLAAAIQDGFRKDGTRRIPRAQKQNVVSVAHERNLNCSREDRHSPAGNRMPVVPACRHEETRS